MDIEKVTRTAKPSGNVRDIAPMPPVLLKQRDAIRKMMKARCQLPDSPIPPSLSSRTADFITMLTLIRANSRIKCGKPGFPNGETLALDIQRAAEATEMVVQVMIEEALETLRPKIERA